MSGSIKLRTIAATATRALLVGCTLLGGVAVTPRTIAQTPIPHKHLYPDVSAAQHDIDAALVEAKRTHKRILLDFGGDWCGDCQVLDIYFNQAPNAELLAKNFIKVNINIGRMDANLDIAHKYGVPVHGVPALAVIDANGKVIVSQDLQFADMRNMQPSSVTDFLNKWKR
ncbi:MAG TPA: thioredoxin family protein [Acidobacteriaceae bacterium]|nr:thioredoxin family protein [Acidobacteriaceae bacterium]